MAKEGGDVPGGMAGLVQYYDEYDDAFEIDPKVIIGVIVGMISFELMLHAGVI